MNPYPPAAHRNFDTAFQALRKFNGTYTKVFADELRHDRNAIRAARLAAAA